MKKYVFVVAMSFSLAIVAAVEVDAKDSGMECQQNVSSECVSIAREIKVGNLYQHYSGKVYRVLAIAHDSEDPSLMRVVYQGLYDCPTFGKNPVWDRPYIMFAENVTINGKEQPRFADVVSI